MRVSTGSANFGVGEDELRRDLLLQSLVPDLNDFPGGLDCARSGVATRGLLNNLSSRNQLGAFHKFFRRSQNSREDLTAASV